MLVVLHFTSNSSSFCYSYIAAEVPFQFLKKILTAWFLPKLLALVYAAESQ